MEELLEFKKLKWRDNVTKLGKKTGIICFQSDPILGITYIVGNTNGVKNISAYSTHMNNGRDIICKNTKEAKEICQNHFESLIKKMFFKIQK